VRASEEQGGREAFSRTEFAYSASSPQLFARIQRGGLEEQEKEQFPKVRKMLGKEELGDLGVVMEDMAEEQKASGAPRESVPAETESAAPLE